MLKKILDFQHSRYLTNKIAHRFAVVSDPYYILGVQKNADFKQIKKCFYKLAREYHPDKRDDNDSKKKFLAIKQAFQTIKVQKGLTRPNKGFEFEQSVDSMRPNQSQFDTSDQQYYNNNRDYRIFDEKADAFGGQYERFRGTFKTLNDINDIKIKVEDGKLNDAVTRFNLESLKKKNTRRAQNSGTLVYTFIIGAIIFSFYILKSLAVTQAKQLEQKLKKQESKQRKVKIFESEKAKSDHQIIKQMEKNAQLNQFMSNQVKKVSRNTRKKKQDLISEDFQSI